MANIQLNKAINAFIKQPNNPKVCIKVADIYYDLNQYGAAISYYLRAAELTDNDSLAYYALLRNAIMLRKQGKRDGTFKNQVLHAITLCPDRPEGYLMIARFLQEKGINHDGHMMASIGLKMCKDFTPNPSLDFPGKYGLLFFKAVTAYSIAKFTESRDIFKQLRDWKEPIADPYKTSIDANLDKLRIPRNMEGIDFEKEYLSACRTPSDINEHLPMLNALAMECKHVTEMGVRHGLSTRAFMYAGKPLTSYDLEIDENLQRLFDKYPLGKYIKADVLTIDIEPTDMLFIDTWHHYDQLKQELKLHASKVKKYLAFHDTQTFGTIGENMPIGLLPALLEFMVTNPEWKVKYHTVKNNGLTVLEKTNHG